jgi:hypothetical protein
VSSANSKLVLDFIDSFPTFRAGKAPSARTEFLGKATKDVSGIFAFDQGEVAA